MFINPKTEKQRAIDEVFKHPPSRSDAPVKLPVVKLEGACFDTCDQECVDMPFHANCPGYCDLK